MVTGYDFLGYLASYPVFDRLFNSLVSIQKYAVELELLASLF